LAWRIEIDEAAMQDLARLDRPAVKRIITFLRNRLQKLENPRALGAALKGEKFGELWNYRIGDYRIIAKIMDQVLVILVARVGHRRAIYNKDTHGAD
jgi:mRNA interferase RelE/StbE